jgi:hypothetical protein
MKLAAWFLGATIATGCGAFGAPSPTPAGLNELVSALVLHGVTIHEQVSGDDGCPRVDLHDNATRLTVSVADDATQRDVYVFRWRRAADYDAAAQTFFPCATDFRSSRPGTELAVIEQPPWRAFGADWSDTLEQALRNSLQEAGGA